MLVSSCVLLLSGFLLLGSNAQTASNSTEPKCDPSSSYSTVHPNGSFTCECRTGFVRKDGEECVQDPNVKWAAYEDENLIPGAPKCELGKGREYAKTIAEDLLRSYDPLELPTVYTLDVESEVVVERVDVNEAEGRASVHLLLVEQWNDRRLAYEQAEGVDCVDPLDVSHRLAERIWTPRIEVVNARSDPLAPALFLVFPTGRVQSRRRLLVDVPCVFHLGLFPLDRVECLVVLESVRFHSQRVHLAWRKSAPVRLFPRLQAGNFVLKKFLLFTLQLRRSFLSFYKPTVQIVQTYLPSVAAIYISLLSFCLGQKWLVQRAMLGFFMLLILSLQYANVSSQFARVGFVTSIDVFCLGCMVFVVLTLVELAVVFLVERRRAARTEREKAEELSELTASRAVEATGRSNRKKPKSEWTGQKIDRFAQKVFSLLYSVGNLLYWLTLILMTYCD
ncbi:Ligand-Gated ion Channel [Aphelenchoides fujianensis]|nr:Ligand-Gated ion Channel [Aphelenchoides fujianensis]